MPAIRPTVEPGEGREQQPPQRLALEEGVALPADGGGFLLQRGDLGCRRPAVLGRLDGGVGGALGPAEVGVGGPIGGVGQVAVDVAGVGLGLRAGVQLLAGEAHEVGSALLHEGGLVGEDDVLGGELPVDVVGGEPVAPQEQAAGHHQDEGDDDACSDEDGIDRAPPDLDDGLGRRPGASPEGEGLEDGSVGTPLASLGGATAGSLMSDTGTPFRWGS